jgi:hypothetical protein
MIVLSGIMSILLIAMVSSNVAIAAIVPDGAGPGDRLSVYFLKKSFDFCDDGLHIDYNSTQDSLGGSVPTGEYFQHDGCVDRWTPQGEQGREDNYAFTGEQIAELVVARDLDGAIAITHAMLQVDGDDIAYCNEVSITDVCTIDQETGLYTACSWKGHEGVTFDNLMNEYPPQSSESTRAGFDGRYDKLYECILTVTDYMQDDSIITVEVTDSVNQLTAMTDDQHFFFNPAVSLTVGTSDDEDIRFEEGYAGDLVYSENKLTLVNDAEGGVDIAVWLGGTDLISPDAAAKCPQSNILDVEGTSTDHEDGMLFRCTLDNGLYIEQAWMQIKNKNTKLDCDDVWNPENEYFGDETSKVHTDGYCLGLNPLFLSHENVLENGHEAECSFKLHYPVPCIGDFTEGNLNILMRAV